MFGFNSWTLLAPQAVEGVASVLLLYAAVRRWFGPAAGLIAGAVLALTPVATLIFRFNNPDSLLVLLMTAAGYAVQRAIERDRTRWLVFAGLLLGFAFLSKMAQAFLVLPGFGIAYLWAGPARLGRRIWQLLAALGGVIVGAGWWIVIAQLTPAADRPVLRRVDRQQHPRACARLQRFRTARRVRDRVDRRRRGGSVRRVDRYLPAVPV